jgi:membrane-bound lytic murein transglycosylase B
MSFKKYLGLCLSTLLLTMCSTANSVDLKDEPKLQAIADQLIAEKYFTQDELEIVFKNAVVQKSVLTAMMNPAEYKFTWGKYRKLFLKEGRIQQGVEFWKKYQSDLDRAEREYGVPASVIVAIIGVESKFGRYKGSHKVLDSLVTLTVGYPRRSKFFGSELKEYLILCKENDLALEEVLGSYAGAMGFPQFISSSYRNYAVDFSGDGKIDLIDQPVDAIGSVANYFIENGWQPGQAVTSPAHNEVAPAIADLANRKRKTQFTAVALRESGAVLDDAISADEKLNVLMLDASEVVSEPKTSGVYVVRAGDTACQIAEKHKLSCKSLFLANNLNKKGHIYRGQRLTLPKTPNGSLAKQTSKKAVKLNDGSSKTSKWSLASGSSSGKAVQPETSTVQARYFFTHRNFYAITEYNHSVLYAMAVHELSKAIDLAKSKSDQTTSNQTTSNQTTSDEGVE